VQGVHAQGAAQEGMAGGGRRPAVGRAGDVQELAGLRGPRDLRRAQRQLDMVAGQGGALDDLPQDSSGCAG